MALLRKNLRVAGSHRKSFGWFCGFVEAFRICTDRHRITCNTENSGEAAKLEAQRLHALSDLQETWTSTCCNLPPGCERQ